MDSQDLCTCVVGRICDYCRGLESTSRAESWVSYPPSSQMDYPWRLNQVRSPPESVCNDNQLWNLRRGGRGATRIGISQQTPQGSSSASYQSSSGGFGRLIGVETSTSPVIFANSVNPGGTPVFMFGNVENLELNIIGDPHSITNLTPPMQVLNTYDPRFTGHDAVQRNVSGAGGQGHRFHQTQAQVDDVQTISRDSTSNHSPRNTPLENWLRFGTFNPPMGNQSSPTTNAAAVGVHSNPLNQPTSNLASGGNGLIGPHQGVGQPPGYAGAMMGQVDTTTLCQCGCRQYCYCYRR